MSAQDLRQPRYRIARVPQVKLKGTISAAFSGTGRDDDWGKGGRKGGGDGRSDRLRASMLPGHVRSKARASDAVCVFILIRISLISLFLQHGYSC